MARKSKIFLSIGIIVLGYGWLTYLTLCPSLPQNLSFCFTEGKQDIKHTILRSIHSAKETITLQIYGLTDPDILRALKKKQAQGVKISIFYDRSASRKLPKSLPTYPVKGGGLMHRKILCIDGDLSIVGTANFTSASLKMHGNLLAFIRDSALTQFFEESIQDEGHFAHCIVYLLPESQNALPMLLDRINEAKNEIFVAMFTLTHPEIVSALIEAAGRGVRVQLAIDRYTEMGASKRAVEKLKDGGVEILVSRGDELLHHKWALIDEGTLLLGSANWTRSAFEKNQDVLLIFDHLEQKNKKTIVSCKKAIARGCKIR